MRSKQTSWNPAATYCFWLGRYPVGYIAYVWPLLSGHVNCGLFVCFYRCSYCCCSVAKFCLTLCDPMDCSMPGFPILHCLLEFAQTHVHWVGDAIQPSHPQLPSSPPALNLSQHQSLFQWVSSSHQVAKVLGVSASTSVLPMNIQGSLPLGSTSLIFLQFKAFSRVFSSTTIWRH